MRVSSSLYASRPSGDLCEEGGQRSLIHQKMVKVSENWKHSKMVKNRLKIKYSYYGVLCKINDIIEENATVRGHNRFLNAHV